MSNGRIYDKVGRPKQYTDDQAIEARRKSLREAQKRYYQKNKLNVIKINLKRYYENKTKTNEIVS